MYFFFLAIFLTFHLSAQTGLDSNNKVHNQLIGDWSVDLEETTKLFEKNFGRNFERLLPRLPATLEKLTQLSLKIDKAKLLLNDGRRDYEDEISEVKLEKNKVILASAKANSITQGFLLLDNQKMKLITNNREQAMFVWQKKKLEKNEADKLIKKILSQYKKKGFSADLTRYVHKNLYDELEKYLKENPDSVNKGNKGENRTALHEACRFKKTKFVKLLLENGADPNVQLSQNAFNNGGLAPIHIIGRSSSTKDWDEVKEICELLLKYKLDVNLKAKYDETPLHSALSTTTTFPNEKLAMWLIKNGAKLNLVNDFGETAIHQAFRYGVSEDFVKFMKENKIAIPNKINKLGMAPPAMAARSDKVEVLKLFLKHGYDLSMHNDKGGTLLHFGISKIETLKYIMENVKDLDIDAPSKFYGTALRRAMATGQKDAVKYLLSKGAKLPKNYDSSLVSSRPDDEYRIHAALRSKRELDVSKDKVYCIKEIHDIIKTHLEKQK